MLFDALPLRHFRIEASSNRPIRKVRLRVVSTSPDGFSLALSDMGRLKKVPPRSARVRKKFEEKLASVESNWGPAGSKAYVPVPIRYTERLALALESLAFSASQHPEAWSRKVGLIVGIGKFSPSWVVKFEKTSNPSRLVLTSYHKKLRDLSSLRRAGRAAALRFRTS